MRWPLALITASAGWAIADLLSGRVPGWPELVGFSLALLLLAWASGDLRSQGFAPALCRGRPDRRRVALTFDDGPDPVGTPRVLDTLARLGVRATFFVVGEKVEQHRELVARASREGHQVELHGWTHRWQQWLTPKRARAALERGARAISVATGNAPRWLRPPFGVMLPALGAALPRTGLRLVGWTRRARDGGGGGDPQRMLDRLVAHLCAGDIILLHDGSHTEGGALPKGPDLVADLVEAMRQRDLEPVTLDELLAPDASVGG